MALTDGKPDPLIKAAPATPDRHPQTPVTWGMIFFITLAIVFFGEFLVMGLVIPYFWPEPTSLWQE
ncbi:MAG: hypothetical protein WCO94_13785, partial [Verrucomicrobiota bacterium]